jgi:aspartate 1-decarboxylase
LNENIFKTYLALIHPSGGTCCIQFGATYTAATGAFVVVFCAAGAFAMAASDIAAAVVLVIVAEVNKVAALAHGTPQGKRPRSRRHIV